jgi:2-amino-4-hydroxy-6-hydroxymethyldihydropteridine diphosphokinase
MIQAFIALGSNLNDPVAEVTRAFGELGALPGSRLQARSSLYLTEPVGAPGQPDYVNACVALETGLCARTLLESLLAIERSHGRQRQFRNAPRTLDLDLLLYDGLVCHEPGLTLPHPRMHERAFVLLPLLEISPDCEIPGRGSAADWLAACAMQKVQRLASPGRRSAA